MEDCVLNGWTRFLIKVTNFVRMFNPKYQQLSTSMYVVVKREKKVAVGHTD